MGEQFNTVGPDYLVPWDNIPGSEQKVPRDKTVGPDQLVPCNNTITWHRDGAVKIRMDRTGAGSQPPTSVPILMMKTVTKNQDLPAIKDRDLNTGVERIWSWSDYLAEVRIVAKSFIFMGLKRFESVCIFGFNSPEWIISSMAAIFAGGLSTGIYPTSGPEACRFILEDSKCSILVVEDQNQLDIIWSFRIQLPHLKTIVQLSGVPTHPGVLGWKDLLSRGQGLDLDLEDRLKMMAINTCCTLVYTSGTTGNPKGVMLSHDNITWAVRGMAECYKAEQRNCRVLSYLPLSHIAGQMLDIHLPIVTAGTTYFADRQVMKTSLLDNLNWCRPSVFFGVPRIWEKLMEKTQNMAGCTNDMKLLMGLEQCTTFFSAAAPLDKQTLNYFLKLDINICEKYGMSENCGFCTMNTYTQFRKGSVGKALPAIETKLVQPENEDISCEKELVMRGRSVMMGYMDREDATQEAVSEDGWLKSGDLFRMQDGFHFNVGRLKDLIITSGGENIAPQPIHERVKERLPIVSQVLLLGDRQKFVSTFLTLSVEINPDTMLPTNRLSQSALNWCRTVAGSSAVTVEDILNGPDHSIMTHIQVGIDAVNMKSVSRAQKIQKWMILPEDFSVQGGELGPTLKLKRNYITKKYKHFIEKIYNLEPGL